MRGGTITEDRRAFERHVASKRGMDLKAYREFFDMVWRDAEEMGESFTDHEDFEAFVDYRLRYFVMNAEQSLSSERESVGPESTSNKRQLGLGDSGGEERNEHEVQFDESTKLRAAAFSEYLAKIASTDRRVMRCRKRICGGVCETLSPEEALTFLEEHSTESHVSQGMKRIEDESEILRWPDGSHYGRDFIVPAGSLLEELKSAASYLDRHYPWTENQAAYFILCDSIPQSATIMGAYKTSTNKGVPAHKFDRVTIKLEIEHWMPAEFVREAYCKIRDKALHDGEMMPQASLQRARLRNMEVFRFVVNQSRLHVKSAEQNLGRLELPEWPVLKDRWNEQLPKGDPRHYKEDKYFKRDFKRAQKAILGTDQGLPGIPGQPMNKDEIEEMQQRLVASNERMKSRVQK